MSLSAWSPEQITALVVAVGALVQSIRGSHAAKRAQRTADSAHKRLNVAGVEPVPFAPETSGPTNP